MTSLLPQANTLFSIIDRFVHLKWNFKKKMKIYMIYVTLIFFMTLFCSVLIKFATSVIILHKICSGKLVKNHFNSAEIDGGQK